MRRSGKARRRNDIPAVSGQVRCLPPHGHALAEPVATNDGGPSPHPQRLPLSRDHEEQPDPWVFEDVAEAVRASVSHAVRNGQGALVEHVDESGGGAPVGETSIYPSGREETNSTRGERSMNALQCSSRMESPSGRCAQTVAVDRMSRCSRRCGTSLGTTPCCRRRITVRFPLIPDDPRLQRVPNRLPRLTARSRSGTPLRTSGPPCRGAPPGPGSAARIGGGRRPA